MESSWSKAERGQKAFWGTRRVHRTSVKGLVTAGSVGCSVAFCWCVWRNDSDGKASWDLVPASQPASGSASFACVVPWRAGCLPMAQEWCCHLTGAGCWESSVRKTLTCSHLKLHTGCYWGSKCIFCCCTVRFDVLAESFHCGANLSSVARFLSWI